MPQHANYNITVVKQIFSKYGIFPLEEGDDGITIWGDIPKGIGPYMGKFITTAEFSPGRYDAFTIQDIIRHLGKGSQLDAIMAELHEQIFC
jgi:hypothetical protein